VTDWRLAGRVTLGDGVLFDGALSVGVGWTCLMGASGAGKTTLLRLLAGLPTVARLDGEVTQPERIGWMAQDDLLQPRLTIAANVALLDRLSGRRPDPARIDRLLADTGLAGFGKRLPASLSGGQRQRVALARALLQDAPVLALDEPFSALDPGTRAQMQGTARRLLAGRAVLMVTHDPAEAMRIADRILILSRGRLTEIALPSSPALRVLDEPETLAALGQLMLRLQA
jgi:putative hydroxymethylpyrimidine transport system ATP-binding protein